MSTHVRSSFYLDDNLDPDHLASFEASQAISALFSPSLYVYRN